MAVGITISNIFFNASSLRIWECQITSICRVQVDVKLRRGSFIIRRRETKPIEEHSFTNTVIGIKTNRWNLIEQFAELVEWDFSIATRVQRLDHRFDVCLAQMSSHACEDMTEFLRRDETVAVGIEFLEGSL